MKKLLVTLLALCMVVSFVGCGYVATEEEQLVENVIETAVVTKEPAQEVTEVTESANYAKEHNIEVIEYGDGYNETFTFIEYSENEDGTADEAMTCTFSCPTAVTREIIENFDGTKTVIYVVEFDIKDLSFDYDYYCSDTFLVDIASGMIFSTTYQTNEVEIDGRKEVIQFYYTQNINDDFTMQTMMFAIVCPTDYEGYGLYLCDTNHINTEGIYPSLDDVVDKGPFEKRVIIH